MTFKLPDILFAFSNDAEILMNHRVPELAAVEAALTLQRMEDYANAYPATTRGKIAARAARHIHCQVVNVSDYVDADLVVIELDRWKAVLDGIDADRDPKLPALRSA